mgnify:CR=1 FL=1
MHLLPSLLFSFHPLFSKTDHIPGSLIKHTRHTAFVKLGAVCPFGTHSLLTGSITKYGRGVVLRPVLKSPVHDTSKHENVTDVESIVVYNEEKDELTVFAVNRHA